MVWHYNCPSCGQNLEIDWDSHEDEYTCPSCRTAHYPPTPGENHLAFFGGDHWPSEMEDAVTSLRGTTCDVPGCYHPYETLARKKPASQGGHISVDNLVPMCHHHARMKGEQDYEPWLQGLSPEQRVGAKPEIEITFTMEESEPGPAPGPPLRSAPPSRPREVIHPIAGQTRITGEPPSGMLLVTAQPFPAGSWRRLVLDYCCSLDNDGACRVLLAAWRRGENPDWSRGIEQAGVLLAVGRHEGERASCHEGRLELDVSAATPGDGLWTAAVYLESSGGRPELTDYLLAGKE